MKQKRSRAPADDTETKEIKEEPPSEQLEDDTSAADMSEVIKEGQENQETETQITAQSAFTSSEN